MKKNITKLTLMLLLAASFQSWAMNNLDQKRLDEGLWNAVENGQVSLSEKFIRDGANIEAKDNHDWTPLIAACSNSNFSILCLLLSFKANIEAKDNLKKTPLMHAISTRNDKSPLLSMMCIVKVLLEQGVHVNAKNKFNETAYDYALKKNNRELIKLLYDEKSKIAIEEMNEKFNEKFFDLFIE